MSHYFGTDGFRGEAGVGLTAEDAFAIGRFLGWYYGKEKKNGDVCRAAIGKDTRRSGYMLEYAMASGLSASGADAYMLHVTTTPGVAYVTARDGFDCGIMISASHNPFTDNGIKLLDSQGEKPRDDIIAAIEDWLDHRTARPLPAARGERIGRIVDDMAGRSRYMAYLSSLSTHAYRGLRIGLDCANGSAFMIARSVFETLGAKVYLLGSEPDGCNINRGVGSTHPEALCRLVREEHLDVGFAFDGDADRCIAVDETGRIVDGDAILYLLARHGLEKGTLGQPTVVCTVMSNMGLARGLAEVGISTVTTAVGDRFVYEAMKEGRYSLGGEQSGHIILRKYATTGDGILTAIMVLEAMLDRQSPLSRLVSSLRLYPQLVRSFPVSDQDVALQSEPLQRIAQEITRQLGDDGRLILRKSGTEPVIRVMLEAQDEEMCRKMMEKIEGVLIS